jgi:hypothetical protein
LAFASVSLGLAAKDITGRVVWFCDFVEIGLLSISLVMALDFYVLLKLGRSCVIR